MLDYRQNIRCRSASAVFVIILLAGAVLIGGCSGKDKIKPSEDSILADNAMEMVAKIEKAYENRDTVALQGMIGGDLYDLISRQMRFSKADISFSTPRLVKIEGDEIMVVLNWKSAWVVDGRDIQNRGLATLVFRKDTLKLIRTEGGNPFRLPALNF